MVNGNDSFVRIQRMLSGSHIWANEKKRTKKRNDAKPCTLLVGGDVVALVPDKRVFLAKRNETMQRAAAALQTHHIHKIIPQTPIDEDEKSRYNK